MQILNRDIMFPFTLGRELYDRAADLFEEERRQLTYEETLNLLDPLPQGVFQVGNLVTGPYGLLESQASRQLEPSLRVPMYTCAEITCNAVHPTFLSTNLNALVNEHRPKLHRLIESKGQSWAWGQYRSEIEGFSSVRYDDKSQLSIFLTLGDCLSVAELRALVARLMDHTGGAFRKIISVVGLKGSAVDAVGNLERAHIMQLLFLTDEKMIIGNLDEMIYAAEIKIPKGEVRRPVVNASFGFGTFALSCEINEYGVRIDSKRSEIAPLRLRRLVDKIYPPEDAVARAELDWQLRDVDGESISASLEEYLRFADPREVVQRLLLARRETFNATCADLGMNQTRVSAESRSTNATLWKLGFNIPAESDFNSDFWLSHGRLKNATGTLHVSAVVDQRRIGELAFHYFRDLEGVLDDALAFVTWALTTDHLLTSDPFSYSASHDRVTAFESLESWARKVKDDDLVFGEKNTLYPLCRGFALLSDYLGTLESETAQRQRGVDAFPKYTKYTQLKRFPFQHNVAFLDLTGESRLSITSTLSEVSQHLMKADAPRVRNDHIHFRRSTADLDSIANCLSEVEVAVRKLEVCGFSRLLFHLVARDSDPWGRTIYTLEDLRRREIVFKRPSPYTWLSMPSLGEPQYLMLSAKFAEPNEMLRFRAKLDSPFVEMWTGFPRRRSAGLKPVETDAPSEAGGVEVSLRATHMG